jgi:hypothetical protein
MGAFGEGPQYREDLADIACVTANIVNNCRLTHASPPGSVCRPPYRGVDKRQSLCYERGLGDGGKFLGVSIPQFQRHHSVPSFPQGR